MKNFEKWVTLKEQTEKTRLSVFDFDGTVANVPEKPQAHEPQGDWKGKDWWGSDTSLKSPEEGGLYEGGINFEVINAFRAAKADPNTHVIMLTGRRGVVAPYVRAILRKHEIYGKRIIGDKDESRKNSFMKHLSSGEDVIHPHEELDDSHEEYYAGDHTKSDSYPTRKSKKKGMVPDGSTLAHKRYVIDKLRKDHGGFRIIEIWDDRTDHIEQFKTMGEELAKNGEIETFIMHQVFPPNNPYGQATIYHSQITAADPNQWKNIR